jgi:hypothetical protein
VPDPVVLVQQDALLSQLLGQVGVLVADVGLAEALVLDVDHEHVADAEGAQLLGVGAGGRRGCGADEAQQGQGESERQGSTHQEALRTSGY